MEQDKEYEEIPVFRIIVLTVIVSAVVMGTIYWLAKDMKFESGDLATSS
jgi:predicted secreted protein